MPSTHISAPITAAMFGPSPLMLCDQLLTLAQNADRAGYAVTAEHLLHLAHAVFEERRYDA
jgi:hypothetical protein